MVVDQTQILNSSETSTVNFTSTSIPIVGQDEQCPIQLTVNGSQSSRIEDRGGKESSPRQTQDCRYESINHHLDSKVEMIAQVNAN